MLSASSPATRKPAPVSQTGSTIAAANRKPASGVAMKFWMVISADCIRPFARSSCPRSTSAGTTVVVALSNTVSPSPKASTQTYSDQMVSPPVAISSATTAATAKRSEFATAIAMRRSTRSSRTPAGMPKNSHGRKVTALSPAMRAGSRVSVVAISGTAVRPMPSARLLAIAAVHSREKPAPSGARAAEGISGPPARPAGRR